MPPIHNYTFKMNYNTDCLPIPEFPLYIEPHARECPHIVHTTNITHSPQEASYVCPHCPIYDRDIQNTAFEFFSILRYEPPKLKLAVYRVLQNANHLCVTVSADRHHLRQLAST
jgi:hypothetical protein